MPSKVFYPVFRMAKGRANYMNDRPLFAAFRISSPRFTVWAAVKLADGLHGMVFVRV